MSEKVIYDERGRPYATNRIGRREFLVGAAAIGAFTMVSAAGIGPARAAPGMLMQRVESGQPVRLGYINGRPWCFAGEKNEPKGFVNDIVVGTLTTMGYDNIESVVITDWAGLVPGLKAQRFDVITGGMFITGDRCANVAFSEPIGVFSDVFLVPTGNPKGIQTYEDIKTTGATLVTVAGFNIVGVAQKQGIPDSQIMKVPSKTEVLAALQSGRADVGGYNYFEAKVLAENSGGKVELTDPSLMPDWTKNWSGVAFRPEDADFVAAYNEAQAKYIGSDEMMAQMAPYGYTEVHLPEKGMTTEWVCNNR